MRRLPAHFQRIIEVKSLVFGKENCVLTSSVDRSIKVWNLEYIFQEVRATTTELQMTECKSTIPYSSSSQSSIAALH